MISILTVGYGNLYIAVGCSDMYIAIGRGDLYFVIEKGCGYLYDLLLGEVGIILA